MILVVPKKTLTPVEKKTLLKKGYVVIECEKPESVRIISPETVLEKGDLFLSALSAIVSNHPINASEKFVFELRNRLIPQPKKSNPPIPKKVTEDKTTKDKNVSLKEPIKEY